MVTRTDDHEKQCMGVTGLWAWNGGTLGEEPPQISQRADGGGRGGSPIKGGQTRGGAGAGERPANVHPQRRVRVGPKLGSQGEGGRQLTLGIHTFKSRDFTLSEPTKGL